MSKETQSFENLPISKCKLLSSKHRSTPTKQTSTTNSNAPEQSQKHKQNRACT